MSQIENFSSRKIMIYDPKCSVDTVENIATSMGVT